MNFGEASNIQTVAPSVHELWLWTDLVPVLTLDPLSNVFLPLCKV